jgi:hypothetical protein
MLVRRSSKSEGGSDIRGDCSRMSLPLMRATICGEGRSPYRIVIASPLRSAFAINPTW